MFFNVSGLQTRALAVISNEVSASNFYATIATISVAIMGFLIVALPLVSDAFSKEKLGRLLEEYREKEGVFSLLNLFAFTIAISGMSLTASVILYVLGLTASLPLFVLTSTLMIVSLVYLGGSIFAIYLVVQTTRPSMRSKAQGASIQP